jgi:hypothetical protein
VLFRMCVYIQIYTRGYDISAQFRDMHDLLVWHSVNRHLLYVKQPGLTVLHRWLPGTNVYYEITQVHVVEYLALKY